MRRPRALDRLSSVRPMSTWDDVRRLALALPETAERLAYGSPFWTVKGKGFVWERPLRQSDLREVGDQGQVLAAYVGDEGAKQALLADQPDVFFTTSHFDGHPSVLVRLERISEQDLEELVTEAWLARAPKRLAQQLQV